ncbi:MAG TPA: hypothetical protein VF898_00515 [Chloroflexota bacterium]
MKPGNVVLLNGTSSAGKSTTARALQEVMDLPYVHTGVDHFLPRVPQQFFAIEDVANAHPVDYFVLLYSGVAPRATAEIEGGQSVFGLSEFRGLRIGPEGIKLLAGMYSGIAGLARAGVNVIVDDVLHDQRLLRSAVEALCGLPVLLVGLRLPREVAERRERERGDRGPGAATAFYDLVHTHVIYDLELDTSVLGPQECAQRIKGALQKGRSGQAFQQLHALLARST